MSKLYELSNQFKEVLDLIEASDEPELYQDTLESLQFEIDEKLENMAKMIKNIEGDIPALKAESDRLDAKIKANVKKVDSLKDYMFNEMKKIQQGDILPKIKTQLFTFSIKKNPASLKIEDATLIPKDYLISQPDTIDNALVKQTLKDGGTVAGAVLTQAESLSIK